MEFVEEEEIEKEIEQAVAAHLQGMQPTPTSEKDTLMLRQSTNTNNINQNLNYVLLDSFQLMRIYMETYLIRIHNKCTNINWDVFIRNQTDPD